MVGFDVARLRGVRIMDRLTEASRGLHATFRQLVLHPLTPAFGVEINGVDQVALTSPVLRPLLLGAVLERKIVLLRGLDLDAERFRRVGCLLGRLRTVPRGMQRVPGLSDVQCLTNVGPDGRRTGLNPDPESLHWHSDGSAARTPARYTLLYAVRVPRSGGETVFADAAAACAALSSAARRELIGRHAAHDPEVARWVRRGTMVASSRVGDRVWIQVRLLVRLLVPPVRHPVIRVNEDTERESLFVGDHAWRMLGMPWRAGRRRVDELTAFVTSHPEWMYRHAWQAGDLLIWDNRDILHRASDFDAADQTRVMLRAVTTGDRPTNG